MTPYRGKPNQQARNDNHTKPKTRYQREKQNSTK